MAEKHGLSVELVVDRDVPLGAGDVRVLLYEGGPGAAIQCRQACPGDIGRGHGAARRGR